MKSLRTSSTPEFRPAGRVLAGLLLLTLLSAVLSLCLGSTTLSPALVPQALLGQLEGSVEGQIIQYVRLPRTCGCLLAGMALAVSGAVIQSVLNNPLAAPNIIGVNSGAGLMVVLCSALFPQSVTLTPLAAFLGAFLGVLLVLLIAERTGASRITLVLAGVAVSNIFSAGIDALVTFFPDAVLSIYTDMEGLRAASIQSLWVLCASYVLSVPAFIYFQSVSGTGNTRSALALELSALVLYTAYITYVILIRRMDVAVCWTAEFVYSAAILLFSYLYLRHGHWQGKRI